MLEGSSSLSRKGSPGGLLFPPRREGGSGGRREREGENRERQGEREGEIEKADA
jgi:hypothetical protein